MEDSDAQRLPEIRTLATLGVWVPIRSFIPKKKPKGRRMILTTSAKGRGE
jgi:hypothetical protein